MDQQFTFGNSASLLTASGFAPIPLGSDGTPLGPVYVSQTHWTRYPAYADSPVAVLTSAPVARNADAPIQKAQDTWLATLAVSARGELKAAVDAIVKRYAGKACPVRLADDKALYVFKLAGAQFCTIATQDGELARVDSAASFIPLNGQWQNGISLLDVMRDELPALSQEDAQRLIGELNACLDAHAAPYIPPASFVAPPILQPGQRLLYGNRRALAALSENGFPPLPVRFGQDDIERDGYSDFMGNWHYNVPLANHGIGINVARGFAVLEFNGGTFRADVDEAIRAMGPCLVRHVVGDQHPVNVAYLFRCSGGGNQTLYTPHVHVQVRRAGLLVLSGEDQHERAYQWDRDVLTVKSAELPALEPHDAARLQRALEALPSGLEYKAAAATKGRKRA